MTYTVRPLGGTAWAEGVNSLKEANKLAKEARQRGLVQVVVINDETGEEEKEEDKTDD